ncbi:MAG: hypothetical protein ACYDER_08390 [Ktedonobacteraceae bacterium]
MSTEGSGTAGIAVASPIIAGIGVGILIGQGIMWCGAAMEKAIDDAINRQQEKLKAAQAAAREFNYKQVDQIRGRLSTKMQQAGIDDIHAAIELGLAEQETLQWSMAQARTAIADAGNRQHTAQTIERKSLAAQLKFDLKFNRSILPRAAIEQAEKASGGNSESLREAIMALNKARNEIEATQSQEVVEQRETEYILQVVSNQLNSIDTMLQEAGGPAQPEFSERQQTVKALVSAANTQRATSIAEAKRLATEAQQVTHNLSDMVSTFLFDAWNTIHSQVNSALGTLTTLQKMLEEAQLLEGADAQGIASLTQRISSAYNDAQTIGQSPSLDSRHRLTMLAERIALLKQDVFTVVESYQQQTIAETIATTLTELGFQSVTGEQPVLQDNGDVIHIAMARKGLKAEGERDDRLVSFDITREGDVNYDFSGYTGETCVTEAQRVFTALRANGVYLLDPATGADLQKRYPGGVTARMLNQSEYLLQPAKNKTQAELAERISTVLKRMQYHNIHQSAAGGSIELEAFNGSIGYHIVLAPEGTMQVFKDTDQTSYADVSSDPSDPIVAEAQQTLEQQSTEEQAVDMSNATNIPISKQQKIQPQRQIRRMLEN